MRRLVCACACACVCACWTSLSTPTSIPEMSVGEAHSAAGVENRPYLLRDVCAAGEAELTFCCLQRIRSGGGTISLDSLNLSPEPLRVGSAANLGGSGAPPIKNPDLLQQILASRCKFHSPTRKRDSSLTKILNPLGTDSNRD